MNRELLTNVARMLSRLDEDLMTEIGYLPDDVERTELTKIDGLIECAGERLESLLDDPLGLADGRRS